MTSQYQLMKFPPLSDRVVPNPVAPLRHDAVDAAVYYDVISRRRRRGDVTDSWRHNENAADETGERWHGRLGHQHLRHGDVIAEAVVTQRAIVGDVIEEAGDAHGGGYDVDEEKYSQLGQHLLHLVVILYCCTLLLIFHFIIVLFF